MTNPPKYPKRPVVGRLLGMALALSLVAGLAGCAQKSPQDLLQAAQTALQNGDTIGAMVKCQKIIERNPKDPAAQQARMLLARIHMKNGSPDEATKILNEIIEMEGGLQSPAAQSAYGVLLSALSPNAKPDDAIADIEKRAQELDAVPEFAWQVRFFVLAPAYVKKGMPDKALEILATLQASAKDEAGAVKALSTSAVIQVRQEKYDDAVVRFQDYLDTHPDTQYRAQLLLQIGSVYETAARGMKDKDTREAEMKKSEEPREQAATLLRKSFEEELDTRKRIETGLQLSDVYSGLSQYDKSLAMLDTLRADSATSASQDLDATLTARESLVYQDQKQKEKAIEVLQKGIEAHAKDTARVILMGALVDLYINAGDYDLAKQSLEKMVTEYPNSKISQQAGAALQQIDQIIQQKAAAGATTATAATAAATTNTAPVLPGAENPGAPAAPGNN